MKSPAPIQTPQDYLKATPPERRKILAALHKEILKTAPGLKPGICHGMIGYGIGPYRSKSGCAGEWFKVGLANQKHYVSLYVCACDADGYLVEKHAARLGRVSTGKSCIRFKRLEDLNLEVAMELVKTAASTA